MKIKQIVVLTGQTEVASSILPGLEQLGLQICIRDHFSSEDCSQDCLIICDPGYVETPNGPWSLRRALGNGCPVLLDNEQSFAVLEEINETGGLSSKTKNDMEAYALYKCLQSDARRLAAIQSGDGLPRYVAEAYEKVQDLRYGENWHQKAALYRKQHDLGLTRARKLNGREMSYNNMVDTETVLEMLIDLSEYDGVPLTKPLSIIVKHANPCGVAYGATQAEAFRLSFATDPKSAFGGVIGFNRTVDIDTAKAIGDSFVEVLLAPGYDPEALALLTEKKPNRRVLEIGDLLQQEG